MRRFMIILSLAAVLLHAAAPPAIAQGNIAITPVDRTMRAAKRANLRSGPGTTFDKVGVLETGQQVRVTGETGDWLRVRLPGGRTAFVYASLLAIVAPGRAVASPAAAVRTAAQVHRAVWEMHNMKRGETFDRDKGHSRGTAFAIGPRTFVTNVHVLLDAIKEAIPLRTRSWCRKAAPSSSG